LTAFCFSAAMVAAITTDTQLRPTRDIHDQIKDIYGVEISAEMVSKITDHVVPEIKEWQNRPLEKIYSFVFMDAMHYKIRDNRQVINKAVYVVMGIKLGNIFLFIHDVLFISENILCFNTVKLSKDFHHLLKESVYSKNVSKMVK
jgi:hypothetical protein